MKILVTGGAGYIGSHLVNELVKSGHQVSVLDNLSNGFVERLDINIVNFQYGDINNDEDLENSFKGQDIIIHLAALKSVEESTKIPERYIETNGRTLHKILNCMVKHSVDKIIFASSGAVYADNMHSESLTENSVLLPTSPYGLSKFLGEEILRTYGSHLGMQICVLRFFNVIGADNKLYADRSSENLLPKVMKMINKGVNPTIYGDDYQTPDGTAVRDYVDVRDVVDAHLQVIPILNRNKFMTFNVGVGKGASVLNVLTELRRISNIEFSINQEPRRAGDPASLISNNNNLVTQTSWVPKYTLEESIKSAWNNNYFRKFTC